MYHYEIDECDKIIVFKIFIYEKIVSIFLKNQILGNKYRFDYKISFELILKLFVSYFLYRNTKTVGFP